MRRPTYRRRRAVGTGSCRAHNSQRPAPQMPGVAQVMRIGRPYKLASREIRRERSQVSIGSSAVVGGQQLTIMAGPGLIEMR